MRSGVHAMTRVNVDLVRVWGPCCSVCFICWGIFILVIELLYAAASLSGLKLFCWSLNGLELCSVADLVYEESCINSALAIIIEAFWWRNHAYYTLCIKCCMWNLMLFCLQSPFCIFALVFRLLFSWGTWLTWVHGN